MIINRLKKWLIVYVMVVGTQMAWGDGSEYGYYWEGNGIVISSYNGYDNFVYIPSEIDGWPVVRIASRAFAECDSLHIVEIPNSVMSIDDSAFYNCRYLNDVTISDSVTSIGDSAFWGCTRLAYIAIGKSVISIGYNAFQRCTQLRSVTFMEDVPDGIVDSKVLDRVSIPGVTLVDGWVIDCDSSYSVVWI